MVAKNGMSFRITRRNRIEEEGRTDSLAYDLALSSRRSRSKQGSRRV